MLIIRFKEEDTLDSFIERYRWISNVSCQCAVELDRLAIAMLPREDLYKLQCFLEERSMIDRPTVASITYELANYQHAPSYN
jgi:hypothetical protein